MIVEEQPSLPPSDWPARAILMWSNGVSQSTTARELTVGEETVKLLRHRWLSSVGRIAAAEKRVTKEFTKFLSLICQTSKRGTTCRDDICRSCGYCQKKNSQPREAN